ncbi:MAG: glycosyltransferase family 4 protein [Actinobacteria bacterium]|nr:MAG: glycosyltransferase family 4 protein [Actinomycetota bacterium]
MRILVCHPQPPFMSGGAETHASGLVRALREAGHEAEITTIPFQWAPPSELVHQMGLWRSLDLREANGVSIDVVVAMKFPAYLINHPRKIIWLIHQQRTAYELWGHPGFGDLSKASDGRAIRDLVIASDRLAFGEAERIFTNSENVKGRLERSLGIRGEVLYHRSDLTERLLGREPGEGGSDHILFPSRFDPLKRQALAVDAMRHVRSDVRLVLVGSGAELEKIRTRVAEAGLTDRVEIRVGVSDDELLELYRDALGVYFGPYEEDYGYVTIEAMAAGRPVIVTTDSGGPLEFARNEETGVIVDPEPEQIAAAFDELYRDRARGERLGAAGRTFVAEKMPDWPGVVRRLLG